MINQQQPKTPSGEPYVMKRTEVLCPNCFKKKLIQETAHHAYCDECGQEYLKEQNSNALKFITRSSKF